MFNKKKSSTSKLESNGIRLYSMILNWSTLLILRSPPNQSIKPSNTDEIVDELRNKECNEAACGERLELTIENLNSSEMSIKNSKIHKEKLREAFSDNPRKALNNFIWEKELLRTFIL